MPISLNSEHPLPTHGCRYYFHPHHRCRKSSKKSQWIISMPMELECFDHSLAMGWKNGAFAWGILRSKDSSCRLIILGHNRYQERLSMAKFRDDSKCGVWHGYPADYVRNLGDRPATPILESWRTLGYVEKHHISKIRTGKPCTL